MSNAVMESSEVIYHQDAIESLRKFIPIEVEKLVKEVLVREYTPTDAFGNKKSSEQTTLSEVILKDCQNILHRKVNEHGNPSFCGQYTFLEWIVRGEIKSYIQYELKDELRKVKKDITEAIADGVANSFKQPVGDALRKSLGD